MTQGLKRDSKILLDWLPSIINHLYWAASSSDGNGPLVKAKWASLLNHVCNKHEGHSELFPTCEHGALEDRKWFKQGNSHHTIDMMENDPHHGLNRSLKHTNSVRMIVTSGFSLIGSRQHKALGAIIDNNYIMKDVPNMSPRDQTSALEGFHKLVCFFAPKQVHYPHNSMKAR